MDMADRHKYGRMSGTVPVTSISGSFSASAATAGEGRRPTIAREHFGRARRISGKTSRANHWIPSTLGIQSMDPINTRSVVLGGRGEGGESVSTSTPVGTVLTR